jgi:hypothetical protein
MRAVALVTGLAGVALGGLWLAQGLDLVRIRPLLCVAACRAVEGGSLVWAVVGALVLAAGVGGVLYGARRRAR